MHSSQLIRSDQPTSGAVICIGGPAFVQSIRPTDEELFKRYNPELQKRSLEEGDRRAQEFDDYVNRLKQWSKSDKSSMASPPPFLCPLSLRGCLLSEGRKLVAYG